MKLVYAHIWQYLIVLPLVPAGDDGTIPRQMHGRKEACYPLGMCDRQGSPGTGSPLFYINSWAMIWPVDYKKDGNWECNKTFLYSKKKLSCGALLVLLSTAVQCHGVMLTNSLSNSLVMTRYIHIRANTNRYRPWTYLSKNTC